jgi:hypothetical protein
MSLYYPGYSESREKVMHYTDAQLLDLLDALWGRDNLKCGYTHDDLLHEALDQHKREWTDETSAEYEQVQFYTKLLKAKQKSL